VDKAAGYTVYGDGPAAGRMWERLAARDIYAVLAPYAVSRTDTDTDTDRGEEKTK
jgi:hypothetical protein